MFSFPINENLRNLQTASLELMIIPIALFENTIGIIINLWASNPPSHHTNDDIASKVINTHSMTECLH